MKILAPAKINIVLKVLGRRPNGYHDLLMLNEKLDVADDIRIEVGGQKSDVGHQTSDFGHRIVITCDDPSVPCDERNLCYKAARDILCQPRGSKRGSQENDFMHEIPASAGMILTIHITKRVPVAAGLGGGSSDAAAVLKGLNKLLNLGHSDRKLAEIGVKLGADVPFFLHLGPCICEGIGDKITPLEKLPNMWILLINPNFPVSTKWVYETFDEKFGLQLTQDNPRASLPRNFKGLDEVVKVIHNDLERVTVPKHPEIERIKKELKANGALASWMSGSGPTVVGMFGTEKACNMAFEKLNRKEWRVIKTKNC